MLLLLATGERVSRSATNAMLCSGYINSGKVSVARAVVYLTLSSPATQEMACGAPHTPVGLH
jgi:hypothetical protein